MKTKEELRNKFGYYQDVNGSFDNAEAVISDGGGYVRGRLITIKKCNLTDDIDDAMDYLQTELNFMFNFI